MLPFSEVVAFLAACIGSASIRAQVSVSAALERSRQCITSISKSTLLGGDDRYYEPSALVEPVCSHR